MKLNLEIAKVHNHSVFHDNILETYNTTCYLSDYDHDPAFVDLIDALQMELEAIFINYQLIVDEACFEGTHDEI